MSLHQCGPYCTPELSVHAWTVSTTANMETPDVIAAAPFFHPDAEILYARPCELYVKSDNDVAFNRRGERISLAEAEGSGPRQAWLLFLWFPPWHPVVRESRRHAR